MVKQKKTNICHFYVYLFLNVYILVRIFKELFFVSSFIFFENYGCLLSRTTANRSNHAIRFMLVFSSSKKNKKNKQDNAWRQKRLFHAVAQQQQQQLARNSELGVKAEPLFFLLTFEGEPFPRRLPPPTPSLHLPTESPSSLRRGRGELMSLACVWGKWGVFHRQAISIWGRDSCRLGC